SASRTRSPASACSASAACWPTAPCTTASDARDRRGWRWISAGDSPRTRGLSPVRTAPAGRQGPGPVPVPGTGPRRAHQMGSGPGYLGGLFAQLVRHVELVPALRDQRRIEMLLDRLLGHDALVHVLAGREVDRVVVEEALVLLDERVLRLEQDADEILAVERVHRRDDREAADELGDQPVGDQVLRHHLREQVLGRPVLARPQLRTEADRVAADATLD